MSFYEIICACVCGIVCLVNCLCTTIRAHKTDKKITKLCEKCGVPIVEDEAHSCVLNAEQLIALEHFVASMRGGRDA